MKDKTRLSCIVNTTGADNLVTQGDGLSAAAVLTYFNRNIPASAAEALTWDAWCEWLYPIYLTKNIMASSNGNTAALLALCEGNPPVSYSMQLCYAFSLDSWGSIIPYS